MASLPLGAGQTHGLMETARRIAQGLLQAGQRQPAPRLAIGAGACVQRAAFGFAKGLDLPPDRRHFPTPDWEAGCMLGVIFRTLPDTQRRKPLTTRVLGLN